jgi:hypothetical protein
MMSRVTQVVNCRHCGKAYLLAYDQDDYNDWKSGEKLIQDALSYLSAGDRELLLSKTCDSCWEKMFGDVDGYEEDCD